MLLGKMVLLVDKNMSLVFKFVCICRRLQVDEIMLHIFRVAQNQPLKK